MEFDLILTLVIIGAIGCALGWRPQFNQSGPPGTNQPQRSSKRVTRAGRSAVKSMSRCAKIWKRDRANHTKEDIQELQA